MAKVQRIVGISQCLESGHPAYPCSCFCAQVNAGQKPIGSTEAMQMSVNTSSLLRHRADHIVPGVLRSMTDAILSRDFDQFSELTMKVGHQTWQRHALELNK